MKQSSLALALLMLTIASASAQQAQISGNVAHGKTLYQETGCYQCHGLAGQGAPRTGPRVSRTEFPFDGFVNQLRRPADQMPPYEATVLSDQDAADIYAYLRQMPPPPDASSIPLLKTAR
ncbi:MAG TPA: cytochrome c [Bradyrhizobium sp.]|uniref:c-type cytochrome n=1 Tax=Bradyrhizobium sp. TaxID=376 RepID=UPI002D7FA1F4|nr:cytochrome c [Bradyrhizobium sp.]HET7889292.1 cytochrome c [Bradyrhizobium sp.]